MQGDTVWLQGEKVTAEAGENVTASLGSQTLSTKIRVLPASDILLQTTKGHLMSGTGPAALTTTTVLAIVTDENDNPLPNQRLQMRVLNSAGIFVGKLGATSGTAQILTTDAQGQISTTWQSDSYSGEVNFEAQLLDPQGVPFSNKDQITIQVSKPYTRLDEGTWEEDANGAWSRSIKASVWFLGEKLPNKSVNLTTQILDYETNQPLAGWQNAAPLDAATGTTDASGNFVTVQRWNPVTAGEWPHDYQIVVAANPSP